MNQFDRAVNQFLEKGNSLDGERSSRTSAVNSVPSAMNDVISAGNSGIVQVMSQEVV